MNWKKLGQIIQPNPKYSWMSHYAGPSFVRVLDGRLLVYVSGRDSNNISRVGIVEISIDNEEFNILKIEENPCLEIGQLGLFDENGASYPWLVEHDNKIFMYYVGWVNGGRSRFQNYTGLAISDDNGFSFKRIKNTPILDRTDKEPFGSGSCCVFKENDKWLMYYTAFEPWVEKVGNNRPTYNIKRAYSNDGINWERTLEVVVDFKDDSEYVIGKPMLIRDSDTYKLWICCRGLSYRVGYAESTDKGKTYVRKDEIVGIDISESGWDSQSIEYAYVFDYKGQRYMIYNGNDFGKTGIGLAKLTV
jgi:hypothetical protein